MRWTVFALLVTLLMGHGRAMGDEPYVPVEHDLAIGTLPDVLLHADSGDLHVKVYYPTEPGLHPVIVFSHGYGGSKDTYFELLQYWASCGYVCVTASHDDLKQSTSAMQALTSPIQWQRRVADIRCVLESLSDLSSRAELSGRMDVSMVGMGGHSFGAFTAMLLAGARVPLPGLTGLQSLEDSRPLAFLWMSPQGITTSGFQEHSWDNVHRPVMVMTGSKDEGIGGQDPSWRLQAYQNLPAGDKYLTYIEGATHFTFVGKLLNGPLSSKRPENPLFRWVRIASVAWWDARLRHSESARHFLLSDALARASGDVAKISNH